MPSFFLHSEFLDLLGFVKVLCPDVQHAVSISTVYISIARKCASKSVNDATIFTTTTTKLLQLSDFQCKEVLRFYRAKIKVHDLNICV